MRVNYFILALCAAVALVGCEKISKPYIMTVDRVDQKVEGNRGYLKGTPPPEKERTNLTRPLIAVDMDLIEIKGKATQTTTIVTKRQASATAADAQVK